MTRNDSAPVGAFVLLEKVGPRGVRAGASGESGAQPAARRRLGLPHRRRGVLSAAACHHTSRSRLGCGGVAAPGGRAPVRSGRRPRSALRKYRRCRFPAGWAWYPRHWALIRPCTVRAASMRPCCGTSAFASRVSAAASLVDSRAVSTCWSSAALLPAQAGRRHGLFQRSSRRSDPTPPRCRPGAVHPPFSRRPRHHGGTVMKHRLTSLALAACAAQVSGRSGLHPPSPYPTIPLSFLSSNAG